MNFSEAIDFRHACKLFNKDKKISEEHKNQIIEFARLSPSSFGLEPWHFLVISNQDLRQQLKEACWGQEQFTSSSFIVIALSHLPHHFKAHSEFLKERIQRRAPDEATYKAVHDLIIGYLATQNTSEWAKRQSYIPLANMMTGAASLGIDSCPMEGFEVDKVKPILSQYINWNQFDISVVVAFGYRMNPQSQHTRENKESIITMID